MIGKMMTAAFAVATLAAPAMAQTTASGSMGSGSMGSGSNAGTDTQMGTMATDGTMDHRTMAPMPHMTRAQMASMKRCQAMTPARMARNTTCMKIQHAHPDIMAPHAM